MVLWSFHFPLLAKQIHLKKKKPKQQRLSVFKDSKRSQMDTNKFVARAQTIHTALHAAYN